MHLYTTLHSTALIDPGRAIAFQATGALAEVIHTSSGTYPQSQVLYKT